MDRHGAGLDDLLRRFPMISGTAFRQALEVHLKPGEASMELALALDEAVDTLLSLQGEIITALPVDAGRRLNVDVGLRWYAARLHDLSRAVRTM
ncbi:hypothetical protein COL8621_01289 [Actibacterium lipolyticum]|uniref:Uncharacterized protein n=2 Tax=Actibacterium lipolyticum TaxID=1524263 RepID=A0A238JW22_9RHOB|nr:hypothetical protein COL8621_01289 [Actibacterium lipolyticum]